MRIIRSDGLYVEVSVSRREVRKFKATWPCSGLLAGPYAFTFDRRNGDLVDMRGHSRRDFDDGPALHALSQDAQQFAITKGALPAQEN